MSVADWRGFFGTCAGAAASLVGLIFVALSVNITRILQYEHLPSRAAAAMGALMLILTASLAVQAPQPLTWLGGEVIALTAGAWWLQIVSAANSRRAIQTHGRPLREHVLAVAMGQAPMIPFMICGVMLMLGHAFGLAWLAVGSVTVFMLAVLNAWILLVEILR
jgi:modulator of FtsH protease